MELKPMEQNEELRRAWEFAERTHTSIFLTGKAGTGKTTFLRTLRRNSAKSIVVVAPTGVAAINAGGVTIHSFFQLPLSPYIPGTDVRDKFNFSKEKLRIIRMLDLLVIDEISMVRSDLLDAIDNALRKYRRDNRPFGGVQLLMIGDLQQLSPIITSRDEELLAPHYPTPYFFGSQALKQIDYVTIELTKVYRQQNDTFIDLLNHVREGKIGPEDIRLLNSRYDPDFTPPSGTSYIRLTTHNSFADRYNSERLDRIEAPAVSYSAEIKGSFPDTSFPTAPELTLKIGAQVMFMRNDPSPAHLYYNGKIGHVFAMGKDTVKVLCDDSETPIEVTPAEWENARYRIDDTTGELVSDVQGTFTQFPLRLAWAITIHKSQGLTFEHAVIDAGASFAPGQVYVALSRCKSLEGMVLSTPVTPDAILTDPRVMEYVDRQQEEARRSIERLPLIKEAYYRLLVTELFSFGAICQGEERLARFVGEHCRRTYPHIVTAHRDLVTDQRVKILEVADKWLPILRKMGDAELHSDSTLERVKRSSRYFHDTILELFEPMFEHITDVVITNKTSATRFKELVTDLFQTTKARLLLLDAIGRDGFTIQGYLNSKQKAIVEATRDTSKKITRKKASRVAKTAVMQRTTEATSINRRNTEAPSIVKVKKERQKKEKKESPWVESLRMFSDGLTPATIAERRGYVESTVWGHLAYAIKYRKLDIHDVLDDSTIDRVAKVYGSFDVSPTLTEVRERLGNKVGFNEIKLVIEHLKLD
ncbi:helix-turn-helix domain-containing protein [uncultured Muribaculum sp.]|uniref:helix-turn-helix domain-containing protein n=1 Tax=uncultured Muribaculum sp. TaxID=1918613 RepID=UPI0025F91D58|nr:helix-turn-helix domain-containing protein [uncultured Muribaculum sp.]